MATSETPAQPSDEQEVERRTARVVEAPDGDPVVTIVLSAEQLAAFGIETPGATVEYTVEHGELRVE